MKPEKKTDRLRRAIAEIESMISHLYPEAEFQVIQRTGDARVWIEAYTTSELAGDVLDITAARQTDILVDDDVALYVLPLPYDRRPSLKAAANPPATKSA